MQRRPYQNGYYDGLICTNRYCNNVSSDLWRVERAVINALKNIVRKYEIQQQADTEPTFSNLSEQQQELSLYHSKLEKLR